MQRWISALLALWSWRMSTWVSAELPPLDCHAHIAPDVTAAQLDALGDVTIFAVTRSLAESHEVVERQDRALVWGCGVHPGVAAARSAYDEQDFRGLLERFCFVGEVGLDRRAGGVEDQSRVFRSVLNTISGAPVIASVHSTGATDQVVDLVAGAPHPGIILHWFLGDESAVRRAAALGCYFSVNSAMSDDALQRIPGDRALPETDFPATSRRGVRRPGDLSRLEARLADLHGETLEETRRRWYRNLRALALASGAIERLPEYLADRLLAT
jgi:TatD DNase family protein